MTEPRPERRLPSVRTDTEAWDLVLEHERLVWWAINKWFRLLPEHERDDAYSCGIEGLFRAAQLWQPERGRFSTYAANWIRQKIERGMMDGNDRRAVDRNEDTPPPPLSLDVPYGNGDGDTITLGEYLAATDRPDLTAEWAEAVARVAERCRDDRDRLILADLAVGAGYPLRDLAEQAGVSGEMVRRDRRLLKRLLVDAVS